MGVHLERQKTRSLLAAVFYRLRLLPMSRERRLKLFLDLEWIFDRLAHEESYEHFGEEHPMRRQGVDYILGLIEPEYSVLDLGCSSGEITREVAKKARRVVGIDHSADAIAVAKQSAGSNLTFHCGDAVKYLDEHGENFDVLLLSHILEHLDEPATFLERFKHHFRFIYVEVPDFDKTIFNRIRQKLGAALLYSDADHVNEFDRDEMLTLLERAGLDIESADYRYGIQRYWCRVL